MHDNKIGRTGPVRVGPVRSGALGEMEMGYHLQADERSYYDVDGNGRATDRYHSPLTFYMSKMLLSPCFILCKANRAERDKQ